MALNSRIARDVQLAAPGRLVELFDIDFRPIAQEAGVAYFIPSKKEDGAAGTIKWRGNSYNPLPISISGITVTGKGALPRPVLSASNIMGTMTLVLKTFGRVTGAILTRWQTFDRYLDDGVEPNPDAHFPVDQWTLDRVTSHNQLEMKIECRSILDFNRKKLPGRQMLRSACNHVYRSNYDPATDTFDMTNVTCPYVGYTAYDEFGNPTSRASDHCSKKVSTGCKIRFGTDPLPFQGFPTMGRFGS